MVNRCNTEGRRYSRFHPVPFQHPNTQITYERHVYTPGRVICIYIQQYAGMLFIEGSSANSNE
jgi:hypothetical protein